MLGALGRMLSILYGGKCEKKPKGQVPFGLNRRPSTGIVGFAPEARDERSPSTPASIYTPHQPRSITESSAGAGGRRANYSKGGGWQQRIRRWRPPQHGRRKTAPDCSARERVARVERDSGRNFTRANQLPWFNKIKSAAEPFFQPPYLALQSVNR